VKKSVNMLRAVRSMLLLSISSSFQSKAILIATTSSRNIKEMWPSNYSYWSACGGLKFEKERG
jgi:hypothetical protein